MDEILREFKSESMELVQQLLAILEEAEEDSSKVKTLDTYGQLVDRVMGGSKILDLQTPGSKAMSLIVTYSELCKALGYKGSQIQNNENLYFVTIGLLFDATEMLEKLVQSIGESESLSSDDVINQHFIDRLKWLDEQFDETFRSSLALEKMSSDSTISDLVKKLSNSL